MTATAALSTAIIIIGKIFGFHLLVLLGKEWVSNR